MRAAVLDTSALARLFLDDPGHEALRRWMREALAGARALPAPPLALYELGRTIQRTRARLTPEQQDVLLRGVLDPVLFEDPPTARVFDLANAHGISFHDASFVALADERGAELVSFDRAQLAAAAAEGIPTRTW